MSGLYFDGRWCAAHGIGRFATELRKRLLGWTDLPLRGTPTHPIDAVRVARCLGQAKATAFFSPGFNVPAWTHCPTVCTVHDLIHVQYPAERTRLKDAYYRWVQRPIVRRSPVTLTVSNFSRQQIIQWYGLREEQVVSVGNGVSEEFTPDGLRVESERPYILYVGNTKPHKNVGTLLTAMSRIDPDVMLVMVTTVDDPLQRQLAAAGMSERTKVISGLGDQQLAAYYRAAIATVLPSHYEGFGLPVVEAMASGCPVIASDRTAIPEIAGDAALLFDADNSDQLVDLIEQVLHGSVDTPAMIQRGLKQARKFNWDSVAARVREAVGPVVTGHPKASQG